MEFFFSHIKSGGIIAEINRSDAVHTETNQNTGGGCHHARVVKGDDEGRPTVFAICSNPDEQSVKNNISQIYRNLVIFFFENCKTSLG